MSTRVIDLLALGIVNGGYDGTSEGSRGDRTRDNTFIPINNGGGVQTLSIKITITSSLGKTVQVNMYGYNTTPGVSPIIDWYWYNSGAVFDARSYTSTLHYIRCQYQYSDRSSFDASEITSATATIEELDTRWWLNDDDRLTRTEVPQYSTDAIFNTTDEPPVYGLPYTFWYEDGTRLTMNKYTANPLFIVVSDPIVDAETGRDDFDDLTYPYPASFWYMSEDDMLTMMILPEPINSDTLVYPYPASFWWYDAEADRLINILIPDELIPPPEGGAFLNAENLEFVKIPRSVTSIGWQAFQGTKLSKVCISRNCKYYQSSFPPGCEVIFYEDMYDEKYRITVSGKNSYRYTDTITHDEESTTSEIP